MAKAKDHFGRRFREALQLVAPHYQVNIAGESGILRIGFLDVNEHRKSTNGFVAYLAGGKRAGDPA